MDEFLKRATLPKPVLPHLNNKLNQKVKATVMQYFSETFQDPNQPAMFETIEALYQRYSSQAYGLALKILGNPEQAEDAVQDAFFKYWRNPGLYDTRQNNFSKWFMMVVRNTCIDVLRKKHRKQFLSLYQEESQDGVIQIIDENEGPEEEVWSSIQREEIQAALKMLSEVQQRLIELAFFKGLTHVQIAASTGYSLGSVKGHIRQGLLKLKVQLDADRVLDEISGRVDKKLLMAV